MNEKFTTAILDLMSALNEDQHPDEETESINPSKYDAYQLGEYIYGIRIDNSAAPEGRIRADVHMQWARLHYWIAEQQRNGVQLEWRHSALCPDDVHVRVCMLGSPIEYTAIVEKSTVLDMLVSSSKRDAILEQHPYSKLDKMAAEDLWNLVVEYECL